jgi:hypothetical protein
MVRALEPFIQQASARRDGRAHSPRPRHPTRGA